MVDVTPAVRGVYKPRRLQASPLFRLVSDHLHRLQTVYDDRFAREYGPWRPVVGEVADKFLACESLRAANRPRSACVLTRWPPIFMPRKHATYRVPAAMVLLHCRLRASETPQRGRSDRPTPSVQIEPDSPGFLSRLYSGRRIIWLASGKPNPAWAPTSTSHSSQLDHTTFALE